MNSSDCVVDICAPPYQLTEVKGVHPSFSLLPAELKMFFHTGMANRII